MTGTELLRAAREREGLLQHEVARRARTTQAAVSFVETGKRSPSVDVFLRMLRGARHSLIAVPSVRPDAVATAGRITQCTAEGRPDKALRALIDYTDGLAIEEPAVRVALAVARPPSTGMSSWDALIAAATEFRLGRAGLPVPGWVHDDDRVLPEPAQPDFGYDSGPVPPAHVAEEFRSRNVLVDARTFDSA